VVLTQVIANNCIHFDTLAKKSPLNSKKYTAMLSILRKEFEMRFQDCWKKIVFRCICNSVISVSINTLPADIQKEYTEHTCTHICEKLFSRIKYRKSKMLSLGEHVL